ncbi:MAG TPA: hypothetical protein VIY48_10015 [Candidatus Paceibacterota bacterium]
MFEYAEGKDIVGCMRIADMVMGINQMPGSIVGHCYECKEEVAEAPSTVKLEMQGAVLLCLQCLKLYDLQRKAKGGGERGVRLAPGARQEISRWLTGLDQKEQ